MYAVIETGGKQYRVSPGEFVEVEKLEADAGAEVELGRVVAVYNDANQLLTGAEAANAKVMATLEGQGRGEKVIVFKFKRKKQYKRTIGHRQAFTRLKIKDIVI